MVGIGTVCMVLFDACKKTEISLDWSRESFTDVARALSRNWQDRRKADAFIAGVERKVQGWASHNLDGSESSHGALGDY